MEDYNEGGFMTEVDGDFAPPTDPFADTPFTLPKEKEVFQMTKDAKKKKELERERQKHLKIHEKTTASRVVSKVQLSRGHLVGGKKQGTSAGSKGHSYNPSESMDKPEGHRRERRETAAEFVAKKKEMFLLSLSLDTKWTEISKLEERARWREDALKKSEEMLKEDSERFQKFLAENDKQAIKASTRADQETQAKLNKVKEIKRLTAGDQTPPWLSWSAVDQLFCALRCGGTACYEGAGSRARQRTHGFASLRAPACRRLRCVPPPLDRDRRGNQRAEQAKR